MGTLRVEQGVEFRRLDLAILEALGPDTPDLGQL